MTIEHKLLANRSAGDRIGSHSIVRNRFDIMNKVDKRGRVVFVQSSALGSLNAFGLHKFSGGFTKALRIPILPTYGLLCVVIILTADIFSSSEADNV